MRNVRSFNMPGNLPERLPMCFTSFHEIGIVASLLWLHNFQFLLSLAGMTEISAALVQPLFQMACNEVKRK